VEVTSRIPAATIVDVLGGRFSAEMGIDVDAVADDVERWFLAATLFGTRIATSVAVRTYRVLAAAGVATVADAAERSWAELVALLDRGGYARYDERTATRLHALATAVAERCPAGLVRHGAAIDDVEALRTELDALPGWGSVTIGAFLRELRGVWPAADPPVGADVVAAAHHAGLVGDGDPVTAEVLAAIAADDAIDRRDLEAALVRLAIAHHHRFDHCPGGRACTVIDRRGGR
jgi:hypothetical protein